jgi:hypothetical protein
MNHVGNEVTKATARLECRIKVKSMKRKGRHICLWDQREAGYLRLAGPAVVRMGRFRASLDLHGKSYSKMGFEPSTPIK